MTDRVGLKQAILWLFLYWVLKLQGNRLVGQECVNLSIDIFIENLLREVPLLIETDTWYKYDVFDIIPQLLVKVI